jgi:hypothetical protein
MTGLVIGVVGIGIAFLTVMVLLSRMGRSRKQQAIDGAEGIDPSVLLQVYRRDETNCADGASRRFVLVDNVDAGDAGPDTLSLVCDEVEE